MADSGSKRLTEIDSLRGFAALAVLAFHFTYKFGELYGYAGELPFSASYGYLGVNLFFVISGFVIFMTLDRTRAPMDFLVSRGSRLYPAYWTALILTFAATRVLGLPGKEPTVGTLLLNIPMFQLLFSVPLVDNVYWTLLVELLFYALAFALYLAGWMHRVLWGIAFLLALRVSYWAVTTFMHTSLPWRISQLLILDFIPFFALGIAAYRLVFERARRGDIAIVALSLASLLVIDSWMMAVVGLGCFLAVWLAAAGRLPSLRLPIFVWIGTISYPLYLLHENIGWAIIRQLQLHGWSALPSVVVATVVVIALAGIVSAAVERPAMARIRAIYRARRSADDMLKVTHRVRIRIFRRLLATAAGLIVVTLVASAFSRSMAQRHDREAHVDAIQKPRAVDLVSCPVKGSNPIVLLALGQSNAGNHGAGRGRSGNGALFAEGSCYVIADPLPGATGDGGSIWSRLATAIGEHGTPRRPLLLAVLAVDASRGSDWHGETGIPTLLSRLVEDLRANEYVVSAVLWDQGEADGLAHTPASIYAADLSAVIEGLRGLGVVAPVLMATSSRCHNEGSDDVRSAVVQVIARVAGVARGPDTDLIDDTLRIDGCHFNNAGLERAAQMWLKALTDQGVLN